MKPLTAPEFTDELDANKIGGLDVFAGAVRMREYDVDCNQNLKQLHAVESELAKVSTEAQFVPTIKANIEAMRHEIQRGR